MFKANENQIKSEPFFQFRIVRPIAHQQKKLLSQTMSTSSERFSKVKWSLESWREVALLTDKILSWEQDWFAGVVVGYVFYIKNQIFLLQNGLYLI